MGGLILFFNNKSNGQNVKASLILSAKYSIGLIAASVFFIFLLWPALWVDLKEVLGFLYYGAFRVGLAHGHNQVFLQDSTRDAGWLFYPVVMLYKTSVFLSLGFFISVVFAAISLTKTIRDKTLKLKINLAQLSLESYLLLFYVGYFIVMSVSTKKIDRYAVIMYPMLALLAVAGYYKLCKYAKSKIAYLSGLVVLVVYSYLVPIFSFYPYYFIYTNPLLGSSVYVHENILAQKPFGVGIHEVLDLINTKYGSARKIAMIDPKPMAAVYGNDNVSDIEVVGTRNFDILILGVNEKMPGKITRGKYEFNKADSVYINGLEYWRIYVRGAAKIKTP
jgi:uncharacterized membrane protein YiaA